MLSFSILISSPLYAADSTTRMVPETYLPSRVWGLFLLLSFLKVTWSIDTNGVEEQVIVSSTNDSGYQGTKTERSTLISWEEEPPISSSNTYDESRAKIGWLKLETAGACNMATTTSIAMSKRSRLALIRIYVLPFQQCQLAMKDFRKRQTLLYSHL